MSSESGVREAGSGALNMAPLRCNVNNRMEVPCDYIGWGVLLSLFFLLHSGGVRCPASSALLCKPITVLRLLRGTARFLPLFRLIRVRCNAMCVTARARRVHVRRPGRRGFVSSLLRGCNIFFFFSCNAVCQSARFAPRKIQQKQRECGVKDEIERGVLDSLRWQLRVSLLAVSSAAVPPSSLLRAWSCHGRAPPPSVTH